VFAFGKLRTPGLREAADYYVRNLKPWIPLQEQELKPVPVPDKSPATRRLIQDKESLHLEQKLAQFLGPRGGYYLLDEIGKPLTTREWAAMARDWESGSLSEVAICLGSSLGWSDEFRKGARGSLSLGPQTLSHELARVVLLEQLYRAWSVLRGHPYHNEG
jgi:23S rRNA (pseudouridine1915-N3)-methyltransferase